jgi:hypothetical protein
MLNLVDHRIIRPAETALALGVLNEMDLLRLKVIARLYARGATGDAGWADSLDRALTRLLVGGRVQQSGTSAVAFVAALLRSERLARRTRAAAEALLEIEALFRDDVVATVVVRAMREGFSPDNACAQAGVSIDEYNEARKRVRHQFLRRGLTCAEA